VLLFAGEITGKWTVLFTGGAFNFQHCVDKRVDLPQGPLIGIYGRGNNLPSFIIAGVLD